MTKSTGGGDWVSCEFIALMVFYCCGWSRWTHINMQTKTHYIKSSNKVRCIAVSRLLWQISRHVLPGSGCGKDGSGGICAASTRTGPLFSFPTTSLLCCWLSVCSSVCLSLCSRPGFICILPAHPYSWWKRVTPRGDVRACLCVCRCACVQDLIGLWSEGILRTESQVEREQGSHCSEHYAFSIVSPPPLLLLYTSALLWRRHKTPFHQAKFGLIQH